MKKLAFTTTLVAALLMVFAVGAWADGETADFDFIVDLTGSTDTLEVTRLQRTVYGVSDAQNAQGYAIWNNIAKLKAKNNNDYTVTVDIDAVNSNATWSARNALKKLLTIRTRKKAGGTSTVVTQDGESSMVGATNKNTGDIVDVSTLFGAQFWGLDGNNPPVVADPDPYGTAGENVFKGRVDFGLRYHPDNWDADELIPELEEETYTVGITFTMWDNTAP